MATDRLACTSLQFHSFVTSIAYLPLGDQMRTSFLSALAAIVLLVSIEACNKSDSGGSPNPPPSASSPRAPGVTPSPTPGSSIDFATIQTRIFIPHCYQCHSTAGGNRGGVNVETYATVKTLIPRIHNEVIVQHAMPPVEAGGPLAQDLQNLLQSWIDAGAPEKVTSTSFTE